jgi:MFS family permease
VEHSPDRGQGAVKKPRIFYGWWVVVAAMVCISTGPGPFAFAALGLFILPLSAEFGWDRAEISFCLTLLIGATAVSLPFIGRLVDRIGSRKILILSLIAMASCLAAIPTFVSELWHFALVFLLIGTIAAGTNSVPYMPLVSAWFDRYRGLAIGLSIAGIGLGYAYVPILLQYLIENQGWRSGYYALSAIVLFVAMPLVIFVLRESPADMGLKPDGATEGPQPKATRKDIGYTTSEIFRHREFWVLSLIFVVLSFVVNGMLAHMVPMLVDRGMDPGRAAAVAATEGLTVFLSRIFIGYLVDHFFAPRVAMIFFTLSAVGMVIFALGAVDAWAFVAAILLGLSLGAEVDLLAFMTGRYFGLRSFGAIYGLLFAAILTGTALGPLAFGIGFETTGSYVGIISICVGINIVAVILTGMLGPYPDWEAEGAGTT